MSTANASDPSHLTGQAAGERQRVVVLVNASAGSAHDGEAIAAAAATAFSGAQWSATTIVAESEDISASFAEAARLRPTLLVVAGGDGTIRGAASVCLRIGAKLGIIPLGTMNLLAKDLGVALDPLAAAEALPQGVTRRIDVGEVNGRIFLHSSTIGIVPRLGIERERTRRDPRAWPGAISRVGRTLTSATPLSVSIEAEGRSVRAKTFALAVSCNPITASGLSPLSRPSVDGGKLAIYVSKHRGRLGLIRLLVSIGSGQWALDPNIVDATLSRVVVGARQETVPVSNDGEIEIMHLPLEYTVRSRALDVVVPAL